jgi:hypothetical protein
MLAAWLDAGVLMSMSRCRCQRRRFQSRQRARVRIARDSPRLEESQARRRRLPSSELAVSIFQLWCTLTFMQVDVRLALNQLWDIGGQHGQESEEGEGKEEDRQEEKEVVSPHF